MTDPDYPWLKSVSTDCSRWRIRDVGGSRKAELLLDLNIKLADGSRLTERQNRAFFETSIEYLLILREYIPELGIQTHNHRMTALLTFFYWLSQHRIRTLHAVTDDHISVYTDRIAYGREWLVRAPHRLVAHLKSQIDACAELPKEPRYRTRLARGKIYRMAGITWPASNSRRICAHILRWLERNNCNVDLSQPIDQILRESGYELRSLTIQALHRSLIPIEELYQWRAQFSNSTLQVDPFPRGASRTAERLGRQPERHQTIPPKVAFGYLNEALKWVIDYAPTILRKAKEGDSPLELERAMSELGCTIAVKECKVRFLPASRGVSRDGLVELLATASFVVIATLSARRVGEIKELTAGRCRQDNNGSYWLRIYIEKTSRQHEYIPVPVAVARAIKCMETLSADAREQSGTESIWQVLRVSDGVRRRVRPELHLNRFKSFCESLDGIEWSFSSHQFRRFFAVVYFWWWDRGDIVALSHHLKHFELEMTRRYVTEAEFGRQWREVRDEWQVTFIRSVVYDSRSIGGKGGERLNKIVRKLQHKIRKEVDVVPKERIVAYLQRLAKKLGAPFKMHVWGTICACPRKTSFAGLARCKGAADTGPVFENATEDHCAECPFAIHTPAFYSHAQSALQQRRSLPGALSSGSLIEHFSESSCVRLDKAIRRGEGFPVSASLESGTRNEV
ncbi:MAG: hypothetical protein OXC69_09080 [Candidatus Tectomicrobia bacterium]|nr:hypothetical protein [Candidatus Tectomicrobia bacterium]